MSRTIKSSVTDVTVYPDRARVTVSGVASLEVGIHQLVIDNLPLFLITESVRASGRGTARVKLMSVNVRRAFFEETPAPEVSRLEKKIEELEDQLKILSDDQTVFEAQARYLEGLRQSTKQYASGLARGRTTVTDQENLGQFLLAQDKVVHGELRRLQQEKRKLNRILEKSQNELKQLQSARPKQRYQAEIELQAQSAGDLTLELTYLVSRAGWQPLYDIRLIEEDGRSHLAMTTIAQITQNTGQDWTGVSLTVSTARPAQSQRLPELKPWYLDVYQPPVMRAMHAAPRAALAESAPVAPAAEKMMIPAAADYQAEPEVAEVQTEGATVTYHVSGKSDIPSDGSPHKTTVSELSLEPDLDYLTIPKHTTAVFRRIKAINQGPGPLLPGEGNLFF